METNLTDLVTEITRLYEKTPPGRRLLVAIAGPPGAGKSTLAYPLTDLINTRLNHPPSEPSHYHSSTGITTPPHRTDEEIKEEVAICVGLDGFHYTRKELDGFDDPKDAHWRRGQHDTFDLPRYLTFLQSLRIPLLPPPSPTGIPFPTFDHSLKDPLPSPVPILHTHRIIIIEGLYTALDLPGWRDAAEIYDLRVFVSCDSGVSRERVINRNYKAGIVDDLEKCIERVDAVDMKNVHLVNANIYKADYIVRPPDEPELHALSSAST